MSPDYLLMYSEQLATNIELLCQNIKAPSNTLFQIRKSCLGFMPFGKEKLTEPPIFGIL